MRGDSITDTALISFNFYCDNQRRLLKIDSFDYYKEDIEYAIRRKFRSCREGYGSTFLTPHIYKDRMILAHGKYHVAMEIIENNPEKVAKMFNLYIKVDSPVDEFVDYLFCGLLDEIRELLPYGLRKEICNPHLRIKEICLPNRGKYHPFPEFMVNIGNSYFT
jgi:hypothetical protein